MSLNTVYPQWWLPRHSTLVNIPSVIHMYILIDIFIWASNRHLNLNVSETVFLIVPANYFPLARLTIPIVARAQNLRVILGSFVVFFFSIHWMDSFNLLASPPSECMWAPTPTHHPTAGHVAQAHHFSQGPLVCPPASVPFPLQSFLNSAEWSFNNMFHHVISRLLWFPIPLRVSGIQDPHSPCSPTLFPSIHPNRLQSPWPPGRLSSRQENSCLRHFSTCSFLCQKLVFLKYLHGWVPQFFQVFTYRSPPI